ncbi:MAG: SOS response-associated peptidase family protein [Candidatus Limivivens sp.]|nr:SOS response-associated peptidase family protein [Candidatus Limivivens sp.]
MCSRYFLDEAAFRRAEAWAGPETREKENSPCAQAGDIHPNEEAWVLLCENGQIDWEKMRWSFPASKNRGILFNVRCESILEKGWFREDMTYRRCLVPAAGFYEWDRGKNKITFEGENGAVLYMAGFYQWFPEGKRFVILTTKANASVRRVHDRMPLIFSEEEGKRWLLENGPTAELLKKEPENLKKSAEYEQQVLPFCFDGGTPY